MLPPQRLRGPSTGENRNQVRQGESGSRRAAWTSCSDATLIGYAYAFEQTGPHRVVPNLIENPAEATTGATPESGA